MNSSSPQISQHALLIIFARGVIARLTIWPALRLAIEQSWGGPESLQKRTWMASVIVDAFDPSQSSNHTPPDDLYIEETLLQIMTDEFDADIDDGSAESVAKDIVKLWGDIMSNDGNDEKVKEWESQVEKMKGKKVAYQEEIGDESVSEGESGEGEEEDDAMDEDAPDLLQHSEEQKPVEPVEPVVDEDGFTLVQSKKKSRR